MKFLLATYNFFPAHGGGSEHYVLNQAKYLRKEGIYCEIICSMGHNTNIDGKVVFEDRYTKYIQYKYDDFKVTGIVFKGKRNKIDIYTKSNKQLSRSLDNYFKSIDLVFDKLEMHGFSAIIGLDLIGALRKTNSKLFIRYYNHVAVSCPKGTYLKEGDECNVKPSIVECLHCLQSFYNDDFLSKTLSQLTFLPSFLPSNFQRKKLAKMSLRSFDNLLNNIDEQIVFSYNMQEKVKKINSQIKTKLIRHGIPSFFLELEIRKAQKSEIRSFGYLGRITAEKGFLILAKSWLEKEIDPSEVLILAGNVAIDNTECLHFLKLLKKRNDVKHIGYIKGLELISFLDNLNFLIVPSQCVETGPLVIHEAIARGCSVIGANLGGVKELCELYNQTLFDYNDVADLSEKIKSAIFKPIQSPNILCYEKHFDQIYDSD